MGVGEKIGATVAAAAVAVVDDFRGSEIKEEVEGGCILKQEVHLVICGEAKIVPPPSIVLRFRQCCCTLKTISDFPGFFSPGENEAKMGRCAH